MDFRPSEPLWAQDFPNEGIHCYFNTVERKWMTNQYPHEECRDWKSHPQRRGKSPWMRFIHAFSDQLNGLPNPFTSASDDDAPKFTLYLQGDGSTTSDGRRAFCEHYMRLGARDWGLSAVIRVFVANDSGWARVECFDPEYVRACTQAAAAVEQHYVDEEENIEVTA